MPTVTLSQMELDMLESILWVKKSKKEYSGKNQEVLRALHKKFQPLATTAPMGVINASKKDLDKWNKNFAAQQIEQHESGQIVATITTT